MNKINKKDFNLILKGASFFATGGGGRISDGKEICKNIRAIIDFVSLDQLNNNDIVCSVFLVGGKTVCDPIKASKIALGEFKKIVNRKISALLPVEVGCESIAITSFIASNLNIPVVDSDIVGMRSSPEIFLEIITLFNIKRTPCVLADDKGNILVVEKEKSFKEIEKIFRNFAKKAGGDAFVVGYPIKVATIRKLLPKASLTKALETGKLLEKLKRKNISIEQFTNLLKWTVIGKGRIVKQKVDKTKEFIKGFYKIESSKSKFVIYFKNENLVVLKNEKVVLTCPDSISLLDTYAYDAVNYLEKNEGKNVIILGKKAIPVWRTKKGRQLFSPKNLGFNFEQKLLR